MRRRRGRSVTCHWLSPGNRRVRVGRHFGPLQDCSTERVTGAPPASVWLAVTSIACERPMHQFATSLSTLLCSVRTLADEPAWAPPAVSVVVVVSSVTSPDVGSIAATLRTVRAISAPS